MCRKMLSEQSYSHPIIPQKKRPPQVYVSGVAVSRKNDLLESIEMTIDHKPPLLTVDVHKHLLGVESPCLIEVDNEKP